MAQWWCICNVNIFHKELYANPLLPLHIFGMLQNLIFIFQDTFMNQISTIREQASRGIFDANICFVRRRLVITTFCDCVDIIWVGNIKEMFFSKKI